MGAIEELLEREKRYRYEALVKCDDLSKALMDAMPFLMAIGQPGIVMKLGTLGGELAAVAALIRHQQKGASTTASAMSGPHPGIVEE